MSAANAEALLNAERFDEAMKEGEAALEKATSGKKYDDAAKAATVVIYCKIAKGDVKGAARMAKDEMEFFKSAGNKSGEGTMLLRFCDATCSEKDKQPALQAATDAKELFAGAGDKKGEAAALCALANLKLTTKADKNDQPEARGADALQMASKAKDMCVEVGDKMGEGLALHYVAAAQSLSGKYEECLETADEALDLFLELKNKSKEAFELVAMSGYKLEKQFYLKALSDAEDAMEIYQALKSPNEMVALNAAFKAAAQMGDMGRALKMAKEGLYRFQDEGNRAGEAEAMDMLVNSYVRMGQLEDALKTAKEALSIFQELGNKQLEGKLIQLCAVLELQLGRNDKAIEIGEDALTIQKEVGTDEQKAEGATTLADAHMAKGDEMAALQVINEMRTYFQQQGSSAAEAGMLITAAKIQMKMDDVDQAVSMATRAQVILGEEGDSKGEAEALQLVSECHMKKEEYKPSLRAAERARTLFRELGDKGGEAIALFMIGQNSVLIAVGEGARVGEQAKFSRAAKDALDKAAKNCEAAIKLGRELMESPPYAEGLLAACLCAYAQVHMMNMKPEESLAAADEAVVLFRDIGEVGNEASALLLSADCLRIQRQYTECGEAANEALRLAKEAGEAKLEEMANEILGFLQEMQARQQQAWMAQQAMMNPGGLQMTPMRPMDQDGGMPEQAQSMARTERARGPALDLSKGMDSTVVRGKVMEIASRITGAEDGEIEIDTPLMEAGLTSNSAILLRDELSQELPGISLPVTLVFDYPSIGAMTDLITSQGK